MQFGAKLPPDFNTLPPSPQLIKRNRPMEQLKKQPLAAKLNFGDPAPTPKLKAKRDFDSFLFSDIRLETEQNLKYNLIKMKYIRKAQIMHKVQGLPNRTRKKVFKHCRSYHLMNAISNKNLALLINQKIHIRRMHFFIVQCTPLKLLQRIYRLKNCEFLGMDFRQNKNIAIPKVLKQLTKLIKLKYLRMILGQKTIRFNPVNYLSQFQQLNHIDSNCNFYEACDEINSKIVTISKITNPSVFQVINPKTIQRLKFSIVPQLYIDSLIDKLGVSAVNLSHLEINDFNLESNLFGIRQLIETLDLRVLRIETKNKAQPSQDVHHLYLQLFQCISNKTKLKELSLLFNFSFFKDIQNVLGNLCQNMKELLIFRMDYTYPTSHLGFLCLKSLRSIRKLTLKLPVASSFPKDSKSIVSKMLSQLSFLESITLKLSLLNDKEVKLFEFFSAFEGLADCNNLEDFNIESDNTASKIGQAAMQQLPKGYMSTGLQFMSMNGISLLSMQFCVGLCSVLRKIRSLRHIKLSCMSGIQEYKGLEYLIRNVSSIQNIMSLTVSLHESIANQYYFKDILPVIQEIDRKKVFRLKKIGDTGEKKMDHLSCMRLRQNYQGESIYF